MTLGIGAQPKLPLRARLYYLLLRLITRRKQVTDADELVKQWKDERAVGKRGLQMINNPLSLSEIAKQWAAVRTLCRGSHRQVMVPGTGMYCETPPDELFNPCLSG
jgi:hypothetical protein